MIIEENWKDIKGYEGFYQISNLGNVRSLPRNGTINKSRILKPNNVKNYLQVSLQKHGETKYQKVHRLVADTFIPNPNNYPQVNHIDGNKHNNCVDNLEWVTSSENQLHSYYTLKNNIKPVLQYDRNGNFIKEWINPAKAGDTLKIIRQNIYDCCNGKRKTAGNYIWKYKEEL